MSAHLAGFCAKLPLVWCEMRLNRGGVGIFNINSCLLLGYLTGMGPARRGRVPETHADTRAFLRPRNGDRPRPSSMSAFAYSHRLKIDETKPEHAPTPPSQEILKNSVRYS